MNENTNISSRELWCAFLVMLSGALLLYARTFQYTWTYDDFMVIVNNPDVHSLRGFFLDTYPGRPLRELSFLVDHALFGLNPAGWHFQNILWHSLAAFLVFLLLRRLGGHRYVAWLTALLFLVHPLNVEVVASISHRKDQLALVLSLLAILSYDQSTKELRPWRWRFVALLSWVAALYAKQTAIALIIVLLFYEWQCLPREKRFFLRAPRIVAWLAAVAGIACIALLVLSDGMSHYREWAEILLVKLEYYQDADLSTYFRTLFKAWAFMGMRVVFPVQLAVEYLFAVPQSWFDPWVLSGAMLAVVSLAGLWFLRRRPLAILGLVWLIAFAAPTSNIWPVAYWAADRYLYAPMVGLALLFSLAVVKVFSSAKIRALFAILVLGCLLLVSWQQIQYWKSDETVHQRALRVSPNSSFLHNELGKIYEKVGQSGRSLEYYRSAVRINSKNAAAHYNLGKLLEQAGLVPQALEHYAQFLLLDNPAYREAEQQLRTRLKTQYGLKFNETE